MNKIFYLWLCFLFLCVGTAQAAFVLDFEGLGDLEPINDFYNGGTGGNGSSGGTDYGINFGSNALAIIDADAGGSGNFGGEPSPDTVMFFLTGSAVLNYEDGFDTGFSFAYSSINYSGSVKVYDGLNATGNVLATIDLPKTDSDGGDPTGDFSPFYNAGSSFEGTAKSIDFGGTVNQIGYDNITFNSATPGVTHDLPFLVGDIETNPEFNSRISKTYFDNHNPGFIGDYFDPEAPTYIVTHGWQRAGVYDNNNLPQTQDAIVTEIRERIQNEDDPINANIIAFKWEGAFTGDGKGNSRKARTNADFAGVLLGAALKDTLGENYNEDVHFIGHSYGTVVNGLATRYLEELNWLDSADSVQFTALDSPTDAPLGFAPNLDADWFINNLSNDVDYLDNYYGDGFWAYGQPLDGANLNQLVNFDHSDVAGVFYTDLIENGATARTNPDEDNDTGDFSHQFNDWITPMLSDNWNGRPNSNSFTNAGDAALRTAISANYEAVLGTPIFVDELPGNHTEYNFNGLFLEEQSPVSVLYSLDIPTWADWLSFDWMVQDAGDGDWFTAHMGSELLFSMTISELIEDMLFTELLGISDYAGLKKDLYFTLNSVGEANASFYIGNLEFRGDQPVPEPTTMILFCLGLLGIAGVQRKKI